MEEPVEEVVFDNQAICQNQIRNIMKNASEKSHQSVVQINPGQSFKINNTEAVQVGNDILKFQYTVTYSKKKNNREVRFQNN